MIKGFSLKFTKRYSMAIVGNLYKLEKQLTDTNLDVVFNYFKQALDINSSVHKRIFELPTGSFEKETLKNGIFAFEQVALTQNIEKCFIESHKKYVDFQLLLDGVEEMGYIDIDKLHIDTPYCETKDLVTYHMQTNISKFVLEKADLAIFFPEDGHIGLAMHEKKSLIHKVVIKVPTKLLRLYD